MSKRKQHGNTTKSHELGSDSASGQTEAIGGNARGSDTVRSEILDAVAEQLPPAELPPGWEWVRAVRGCLRGTDTPEQLLDVLHHFDRADVMASRLATEDESGRLRMWPPLARKEPLVLLRNEEGRAFDLVSTAGCLSGRFPMHQTRQDAEFQSRLGETSGRIILVTPRFQDFVLLRSIGVAAAPATSLHKFSARALRELLDLVGSLHANLQATQESDLQCEVILVAASISDLSRDPPQELFPASRHLAGADRHLRMDFDQLGVWWPTHEEMDCLRFARRVHDVRLLRAKLRDPEHSYRVGDFTDPQNLPAPPTAAEEIFRAHENLVACLCGKSDRRNQRKAAKAYFDAIETKLIQPLLEESFESTDLISQNLMLQSATAFLAAHLSAPHLHSLLVQRLSDPGESKYWNDTIQQVLKESVALTTMVEKLLRKRTKKDEKVTERWPWTGGAKSLFRAN